jgi:hypothetical protein
MSRVQTSYYGAEATTRFQWATTDNDLFDRELDLYYMSQALERHDHSAGRGLAVTRIADLTITQSMYGLLSIPTGALQDLSVTTAKLAAASVTDDKMANQKANRAGDTFTNPIRIQLAADAGQGYVYMGNGNNYIGQVNTTMYLNNNAGGGIMLIGDPWTYRPGNTNTGYLFYGSGQFMGWDGTRFVANGNRIHTDQFDCTFPMGGMCAFRTNAEIVAAGAKFARDVTPDGRFLVGAGSTAGQTFAENTQYGVNWTPMSGLGVNAGNLAVNVSGISLPPQAPTTPPGPRT